MSAQYVTLAPVIYLDGGLVREVVRAGVIITLDDTQAAALAGSVVYVGPGTPFVDPSLASVGYNTFAGFPVPGDEQHLYLDKSGPALYRWSNAGQAYVPIVPPSAISALSGLTPTAVKTSGYTAVVGDLIPADTTSGAFTVTLPSAPADKSIILVKKIDSSANAVTVQRSGFDVFNIAGGASSLQVVLQDQTVALQYRASGAIWYVTAHGTPVAALDARFNARFIAQPVSGTDALAVASGTDGASRPYTGLKPSGPESDIDQRIESKGAGSFVRIGNDATGDAAYAWLNVVDSGGVGYAQLIGKTSHSDFDWWLENKGDGHFYLYNATSTKPIILQAGGTDANQDFYIKPNGTGLVLLRDDHLVVYDNADGTKRVKLELSSLTTGTTRTLTVPDISGTIALKATINEYDSTSAAVNLTNQTVPTGVSAVRVTIIAPGAGGGSGRRGAAGTVRCGGGSAGGSGVTSNFIVPASQLGATFSVTIAAGGAGGAAVTANDTNGNGGSGSSATAEFASGSAKLVTWAGGGGGGGTASAGAAGARASGTSMAGASGTAASTTGGAGTNGNSDYGPPSGGTGGGITSADAPGNGGSGGIAWAFSNGNGGAAGVVGGASPGAGEATKAGLTGGAAGGGAASITGAAQAGANATAYGAGGSGGGASLNGNNSGAGGKGGPGYMRLEWVY